MKSDIRRVAEGLLDTSLDHSKVGRLINKNRDTVRRMRCRVKDADSGNRASRYSAITTLM